MDFAGAAFEMNDPYPQAHCPESLWVVWEWFLELSRCRGSNGWSLLPIAFHDIWAWTQLTGLRPTRFQLEALSQVDRAFLKHTESKRPTKWRGANGQPEPGEISNMVRGNDPDGIRLFFRGLNAARQQKLEGQASG